MLLQGWASFCVWLPPDVSFHAARVLLRYSTSPPHCFSGFAPALAMIGYRSLHDVHWPLVLSSLSALIISRMRACSYPHGSAVSCTPRKAHMAIAKLVQPATSNEVQPATSSSQQQVPGLRVRVHQQYTNTTPIHSLLHTNKRYPARDMTGSRPLGQAQALEWGAAAFAPFWHPPAAREKHSSRAGGAARSAPGVAAHYPHTRRRHQPGQGHQYRSVTNRGRCPERPGQGRRRPAGYSLAGGRRSASAG